MPNEYDYHHTWAPYDLPVTSNYQASQQLLNDAYVPARSAGNQFPSETPPPVPGQVPSLNSDAATSPIIIDSQELAKLAAAGACMEALSILSSSQFSQFAGDDGKLTLAKMQGAIDNDHLSPSEQTVLGDLMHNINQLDSRTAAERASGVAPYITMDGLVNHASGDLSGEVRKMEQLQKVVQEETSPGAKL